MKLPEPSIVNYWRLAENRIFYIDYEIDESVLEIQKSIISINIADNNIPVEDRIPIKILLNTPGGYLTETYSLIDVMLSSKTPIITVNVGTAYSGGFLVLIAGSKRYSLKHSKAMVHTGSGGTQGTFEQVEEQQKMYRKQIDEMGLYILEQTKIDDKMFKKNKSKDWYMDIDEQICFGVINSVVEDLSVLF